MKVEGGGPCSGFRLHDPVSVFQEGLKAGMASTVPEGSLPPVKSMTYPTPYSSGAGPSITGFRLEGCRFSRLFLGRVGWTWDRRKRALGSYFHYHVLVVNVCGLRH